MRLFLALLFLGQVLMAATVDFIETGGVKVPLIFEQEKRLPIVSMQLVFQNSGSIEDGKSAGLAKLCAKIMNEGTKTLGSNAFALELDKRAIHLSAHTGTETFVFEMGMLKEQLDDGAKLLKSLLEDPNITKGSLQKVQTLTLGALSRKENDYDYVAAKELKALLFENTPIEQPQLGTEESIKAITLEQAEGFLKEHLVLENLMIVIGGDISLEEAKKTAGLIVENLPKGSSKPLVSVKTASKPKESVLKRTTEQAYIYFGSPYNLSVGDEEYYKARVATYILGTGGFGSRLMEEIRVKRGLAYSAYGRISINKSHNYFTGYLQTKNESLEEAKSTVKEVIADFVKNGVTQAELDQAKKFLLGSEPLRVETLSQRLSRTFMEYYKGEEIGSSAKELERIRSLELDDLNRFIKKHSEINDLSFAIVTE